LIFIETLCDLRRRLQRFSLQIAKIPIPIGLDHKLAFVAVFEAAAASLDARKRNYISHYATYIATFA